MASVRTAKSQSQGKKCLCSGNLNSGILISYFHTIIVGWFTRMTFSKPGTASLGRSLVTASTCKVVGDFTENVILARSVPSLLGSWKTLKEKEKFQNSSFVEPCCKI